jgi:hypothetical protein
MQHTRQNEHEKKKDKKLKSEKKKEKEEEAHTELPVFFFAFGQFCRERLHFIDFFAHFKVVDHIGVEDGRDNGLSRLTEFGWVEFGEDIEFGLAQDFECGEGVVVL